MSLSARRAWIEINMLFSVVKRWAVALRKESVDRNGEIVVPAPAIMVALRKESVDRNIGASYGRTAKMVSLSARRAWIEIASKYARSFVIDCRSPQGERG